MKKRTIAGCLCVLFFFTSTSVYADASNPTEAIRKTTDHILNILSNPDLKGPEKEAKRKRLVREVVDERFDWEEMSRRALARHWTGRTEEERKEFIELFGKLLERTYMDKVDSYSGEEVLYVGDRVEDDYAKVDVVIVTKQEIEIPVLYRMKKNGDEWYVYDISIEGVSLINNYRTQFNSIISRSSYQELLERLKEKVAEEEG